LEVFCFDQIDSTNKEAKRMLSNGFSKEALLVAAEQTAGRGRLGRSFYSPADTGVYMTVLLHPSAEISTVLNITSAAALAVCLAIEELTDLLPGIKWVNDIYLNRKKVGGILTEAVTDVESGTVQSVLVGIGINVSTTQFPKEIQDRAASIGRPLSRQVLAASICDHLYKMSKNLSDPSIMEQYRARSIMIGQEVDFYIGDEKTSGTVLSIDEQGGLVVETQNGDCKTLRTGEVTLRFKGEAR
jgi:BirA family biotin operon repressor/biotin-[acetyl-CoA-carboxylase] ligase